MPILSSICPCGHTADMSPIDEDLRSANNSSLPVFRLPPEILADIFTLGARHLYYETTERFDFDVVPDWVNVSYVCRYWRGVALNCSTLWTYHFTVSARWTEELLARSKQAFLKVRYFDAVKFSPRRWALTEKLLLDRAEQIQDLHLHLADWESNHSQLSGLRAPYLQTLDVRGKWLFCPLGPAIERWDIPALHVLRIYKCSLRWQSLDLSRLTTLSLCYVPRQSIVDILATLQCMQYLTVLHLEHALASAHDLLSSGTFELSPKLSLPCLARLCLIAPLSTVAALLSCINIPPKTEVEVEIILDWSTQAPYNIKDYAQICSILAQEFDHFKNPSLSGPTIPSLFIKFPASPHESFMLYGDYNPYMLQFPLMAEDYFPIMVRFSNLLARTPASDGIYVLHKLPSLFPLTQVTTLHIDSPPFLHEFWKKTLGSLIRLRYLKLTNGFMPDLASLLAEKQALGWRTHCHTFVPELEILELCSIDFTLAQDPPEHGVSQESLLVALATRKAPHPRLIMNWCSTYRRSTRR